MISGKIVPGRRGQRGHPERRRAADSGHRSRAHGAAAEEAFRHVRDEAIQLHGGIGFTWEHDLHLYFKRAKYLEFALGRPVEHREVVARAVLGGRG